LIAGGIEFFQKGNLKSAQEKASPKRYGAGFQKGMIPCYALRRGFASTFTGYPLKGLSICFILDNIRFFLLLDILSNHILVDPNRNYIISSRPNQLLVKGFFPVS
jgi:hypothetical protein